MIDEFTEGFRDNEKRLWDLSWLEELGRAPQELNREEFNIVNTEDESLDNALYKKSLYIDEGREYSI